MDESLNIREYIDSGILDLYVSGTLSEAEAREVTALSEKYPEIQEAISRIEQTMMQYFEAYAGDGPADSVLAGALSMIEEEENDTPIIPLNQGDSSSDSISSENASPSSTWRWLAAAAVALLLISVVFNFVLYNRWQDMEGQFASLMAERTQLAEENQHIRARMEQDQQLLAHLSDPVSESIRLRGVPLSPESQAAVVWNPTTQKVLLAAHSLPQPEAGFQYQLWAIVDGVPVDAGVFAHNNPNQFLKLVSGDPAAFAITLEKEGGSPTPTLEQMYVYGEPV
ncbi:MAG: anti-sigma factor [Bacteroidota bacterium]